MGREYGSILDVIGKTPLIKLNKITRNIKSQIYAKAEFLNPGGSVKDRIGLKMIEAAERDGLISPGGTIVEATAGNTGVGLAMAASLKGYRCIFVVPDKMSREKINLLKAYGAEVVITPASAAHDSPQSYNGVADRLAGEIPGAYRPNQFENPNNPLVHYLATGPEIWEDSGGRVQVLVAGMGTGGTISGTGKYLKEKNPRLTVVGADPEGSILSGDSPRSYKVEGIGEDYIPKTFNRQVVDEMVRVSDSESFNAARRLAREEGLLAGGSSGTAVAAALKYAARLDSPKYIVAVLPDTGRNYLDKMFSDGWMLENGFLRHERKVNIKEILGYKDNFPELVFVSPADKLEKAVSLMQEYNISQLPVIEGDNVLGSLNESSLMQLLHDGIEFDRREAGMVMGRPIPSLDEDTDISEAYRVLLSGESGIVVKKAGRPAGLITRADLVNYWFKKRKER